MERLTMKLEDGHICAKHSCDLYNGDILLKLAEYEDAEENGMLFRAPCKVGDKVYSSEPFKDGKVREGGIVQINIDEDGFCGFWVAFDPTPAAAEFIDEDIGKTVFFDREAAEKHTLDSVHDTERRSS